jgi:hypothetical protein
VAGAVVDPPMDTVAKGVVAAVVVEGAAMGAVVENDVTGAIVGGVVAGAVVEGGRLRRSRTARTGDRLSRPARSAAPVQEWVRSTQRDVASRRQASS